MLKYRCLVLDHDDTVVQTDKTLGYPFFCEILAQFRPGESIGLKDYVSDCHNYGFAEMCRRRWNFSKDEQKEEYSRWMAYVKTHIPETYSGIARIIQKQKEAGGLICVVSHSSLENISRDYAFHFGLQPDAIYGWDLPEEQRKPSSYPLLDIIQRYQLTEAEILVVDDMKLGWKMAAPLQIPVAFAAWGKAEFPELSEEMRNLCRYTFETTEQLYTHLFEE